MVKKVGGVTELIETLRESDSTATACSQASSRFWVASGGRYQ
ncbi:MAG: hypothetical protein ACFE95_13040 [Candidatus Hodarchaeota archaeon]